LRDKGYSAIIKLRSGPKFQGPLDDWIVWKVFLHGCYWTERQVEPALLESARQSEVVFDVGAHMGYYTEQFADHAKGEVHAFEPNLESFEHLQRNVKLNDFQNAVLKPLGVSSSPGELTLQVPRNEASGSASFQEHHGLGASDPVMAKVTTLDDYFAANDLKRIDTMKIDVEGHELEVIKGANQLLSDNLVRRLFLEWNETTSAHSPYEDLFGLLEGHGYAPWSISAGKIIPFNHQPASLVLFESSKS